MKIQNTPGPWIFGYTDTLKYAVITNADSDVVCLMQEGVTMADGRLMAGAFEMLEALREAEAGLLTAIDRLKATKPADYPFDVTSECKALEVVRAAMTKVTGVTHD